MSAIELVTQEESCGCTVACIAMVLGKKYWEIRADFQSDFDRDGMEFEKVKAYLGDHGCSIISKRVAYYNDLQFCKKEMWKPFAPVHVVWMTQLFDMPHSHVVVMDAKGKIYDPAQNDIKIVKNPYAIHETIGIYR